MTHAAPVPRKPAPAPQPPTTRGGILRRCACGGAAPAGGECEACRRKREQPRRSAADAAPEAAPGAAMEPRLGHSFAHVRVHAGAAAPAAGRGQVGIPRTSHGLAAVPAFGTTGGQRTMGGEQAAEPAGGDGGPAAEPQGEGSRCAVNGSFTSIPAGHVPPQWKGNFFHAPFKMTAEFTSPVPCSCKCGEYRQHVFGKFERNGQTGIPSTDLDMCGKKLHPTDPQEDCLTFEGGNHRYGHRDDPTRISKFTPDQVRGCTFEGEDTPGMFAAPGERVAMDLHFTGKLVDVCDDRELVMSAWNVKGEGVG